LKAAVITEQKNTEPTPKPQASEIPEEELAKVAGGQTLDGNITRHSVTGRS